jgi:nicotinamide phosphoribosyltransferase
MKFAIKCSYVVVAGVGLPVAKDPITDQGKRNKPGLLKLSKVDGVYQTFSNFAELEKYKDADDHLVTVFENGKLLKEYSLETIRASCDIDLNQLDSMPVMETSESSK